MKLQKQEQQRSEPVGTTDIVLPFTAIHRNMLALVGGTVATTWGMIRATDAQQRRNSVPAGQACGAHRVPAYLWAAPPLRSKFKTFEPGRTSPNRPLLVLNCSGITDTSS